MELLRLALLYLHLIACCAALGLILKSDLAMSRHFLHGAADHVYQAIEMNEIKTMVGSALLILWVSGSGLIWLDASRDGMHIFANPKLQAKIIVAVLLSLNGWLLHWLVLPAWEQAGSLMQLPRPRYLLTITAGAVSAISWLYAALLGAGHALSWKYSLVQLLAAYPLLIGATGIALLLLPRPHKRGNKAAASGSGQAADMQRRPTLHS